MFNSLLMIKIIIKFQKMPNILRIHQFKSLRDKTFAFPILNQGHRYKKYNVYDSWTIFHKVSVYQYRQTLAVLLNLSTIFFNQIKRIENIFIKNQYKTMKNYVIKSNLSVGTYDISILNEFKFLTLYTLVMSSIKSIRYEYQNFLILQHMHAIVQFRDGTL